jgi:hypothetical protein
LKLIFIIGCGRSGTTLMQRLMHCFVDTFVAPLEHPVSKFDEIADYPVAVVKRTATCHRTLWSLPPDNIVSLLCMVRHPFDVLTSRMHYDDDHFHIEPKRWSREFHALEALEQSLPRPHIVFVRYETLVQCPDSVQADIARSYGLEIYRLFSTSATSASDPCENGNAIPASWTISMQSSPGSWGWSVSVLASTMTCQS